MDEQGLFQGSVWGRQTRQVEAQGYTPYLYAAGMFQRYGFPRRPAVNTAFGTSGGSGGNYDFSSMPPLWPTHDGPQTIEQIIAQGYLSVPRVEPTTAILGDKKLTSWQGLDDAIRLIQGRQRIYNQNMEELILAQCDAKNALFRQEARQGHPADARQWYGVCKRLQGLYEEQRAERVNLWRDVARVRTTLPEIAQLYLAAYRKVALLSSLPPPGVPAGIPEGVPELVPRQPAFGLEEPSEPETTWPAMRPESTWGDEP